VPARGPNTPHGARHQQQQQQLCRIVRRLLRVPPVSPRLMTSVSSCTSWCRAFRMSQCRATNYPGPAASSCRTPPTGRQTNARQSGPRDGDDPQIDPHEADRWERVTGVQETSPGSIAPRTGRPADDNSPCFLPARPTLSPAHPTQVAGSAPAPDPAPNATGEMPWARNQ
jgi:hypothetical protein